MSKKKRVVNVVVMILAVLLLMPSVRTVWAGSKESMYVLVSETTPYKDVSGKSQKKTVKYTYNSNGLLKKTDDSGSKIVISYDKKNRISKSTMSGQSNRTLQMSYDSKGRLSKCTGRRGSDGDTYKYDSKGRVNKLIVKYGDNKSTTEFKYNSKNQVSKMIFKDDKRTVTYKYDKKGNLTFLDRGGSYQYSYKNTYDKNGLLVKKVRSMTYTDYDSETGKEVKKVSKSTTTYKYKKISVKKSLKTEIEKQQRALINQQMPDYYFLNFWSY